LALEENHLLPGDPYRVFNAFMDKAAGGRIQPAAVPQPLPDPTTLKPPQDNPFSGG
jgi:hypothetical protein